MFEQSLLLDHAAGKKTGALAASLTAQTLAVGVLIAIPLIFSDRLPNVHFTPLSLPAPLTPLPPEPIQTAASSSSRASSGSAKVFRIPTHTSDLSRLPDVSFVEAPPTFSSSSSEIGDPLGALGAGPSIGAIFHEPAPKPKPVEAAKTIDKPLRVGGDVLAAKLLKKVMPVYPSLARQARVSGTVELLGIIAKDGTIQQLQVISGHPLLVRAALDAVRQWLYRPTLLNGQAVEVIAPISVSFTLSQ
jgi:protein TonB